MSVGADLEIRTGMPLPAALKRISEEILPLVTRIRSVTAIPSSRQRPRTLSTALCLPISSAKTRIFRVSQRAALWTPCVVR